MATQPLPHTETQPKMSVEEYLATVFRPDCDYVDCEVQERNWGELDHGRIQKRLVLYFGQREKQWGIEVVPEQRVQVSPTRFRIPDVCVVIGQPDGQIFRKPPFLCIEVMSPEDRISRVRERVTDYLQMGVPHIWVVDPQTKSAFTITAAQGWREVMDGILRTANPNFELPLSELFS